jgi:hypothetical protein
MWPLSLVIVGEPVAQGTCSQSYTVTVWPQQNPGSVCFLSSPSAFQALKKDEGVPWTGMLAIVHSYVTHKTGKESLVLGVGLEGGGMVSCSPSSIQASGFMWNLWEAR